MKVERINVLISTHANKNTPCLHNQMFALAKEHKIQGEFGNDYIVFSDVPKGIFKVLRDLKIKFSILRK